MMGLGLLSTIAVIVALIWGLGWLRQEGRSPFPGDDQNHRQSPLDILQARYARGEISQAEYERLREDLRV
ncbi:MAG: SHOCT domain-containing protein [Phycisphaerae bacterium]|nr:SHOCT domain-containing protein [Phycisphaerae bacterium]